MQICINEIVLSGNFAGETDEENNNAAKKFCDIVSEKLCDYCSENYPNAEIKIEIEIQDATGCSPCPFSVNVEPENSYEIKEKILWEYRSICSKLERSGEIYEG